MKCLSVQHYVEINHVPLNRLNLGHYYFPLALAVVTGLLGAWVLRHLPDGNEHKKARRDQRIGGWLLVTLGLLGGGGIVCCTPPPWERSRYVKSIVNAQPDDVEQIVIIPEPDSKGAYSGPFLNEVVFDDRESIRAICAALKTAEEDSTGNYQKVWRCRLRLVLSDGAYECQVEKDWMNHSFVCFQLGGGYIGQLRCDELGNLLEWIPRPSGEDKSTSIKTFWRANFMIATSVIPNAVRRTSRRGDVVTAWLGAIPRTRGE